MIKKGEIMKKLLKIKGKAKLEDLIQKLKDQIGDYNGVFEVMALLDSIASLFIKKHKSIVPELKNANSLVDVFKIFKTKKVISNEHLASLEDLIIFFEQIDYDYYPELSDVDNVRNNVCDALDEIISKLNE